MSSLPRIVKPTTEELPHDLIELKAAIETLSVDLRYKIEPILSRVIDSTKRRRKIMNLVQDALSQLRLDMKYLLFDLEATRRERDEYKKIVEGTTDEPEV
jgi:hypothetical protein